MMCRERFHIGRAGLIGRCFVLQRLHLHYISCGDSLANLQAGSVTIERMSESANPIPEDVAVTKTLVQTGEFLGPELLTILLTSRHNSLYWDSCSTMRRAMTKRFATPASPV
jgi:hypothetical protein